MSGLLLLLGVGLPNNESGSDFALKTEGDVDLMTEGGEGIDIEH